MSNETTNLNVTYDARINSLSLITQRESNPGVTYWRDLVNPLNEKTFQNKDHHLEPVFIEFLTPLYDRLSDPKLLKRCVPGYSQNANESLNALVWNRCPKHRNHGITVASATIQFNCGAKGRHPLMAKHKIPAARATRLGSQRKDKKKELISQSRGKLQHIRMQGQRFPLPNWKKKRKQMEGSLMKVAPLMKKFLVFLSQEREYRSPKLVLVQNERKQTKRN